MKFNLYTIKTNEFELYEPESNKVFLRQLKEFIKK